MVHIADDAEEAIQFMLGPRHRARNTSTSPSYRNPEIKSYRCPPNTPGQTLSFDFVAIVQSQRHWWMMIRTWDQGPAVRAVGRKDDWSALVDRPRTWGECCMKTLWAWQEDPLEGEAVHSSWSWSRPDCWHHSVSPKFLCWSSEDCRRWRWRGLWTEVEELGKVYESNRGKIQRSGARKNGTSLGDLSGCSS